MTVSPPAVTPQEDIVHPALPGHVAARVGLDKLLASVAGLYEIPTGGDPAEQALRLLAPFFDTDKGFFIRVNKRKPGTAAASMMGFARFSRNTFRTKGFAADCIYLASQKTPVGGTLLASELVMPDVLQSSPVFREIAVAADVEHMVGGLVENNDDVYEFFSFWRAASRGDFDDGDKGLLAFFLPHIRRMLASSRRARELDELAAELKKGGLRALEHLRHGILLLNREGRVVFNNREAGRICHAADGISIGRNKLRFAAAKLQKQFAQAVAAMQQAPRDAIPRATRSWRVPRKTPGLAYEVSVTPATPHVMRLVAPREATVSVVISDPRAMFHVTASKLIQQYGLTPAEARICKALVDQGSLAEAADACSVEPETARSHLKRVFAKLGVASQVQLIQWLGASFRPLQGGAEPFDQD